MHRLLRRAAALALGLLLTCSCALAEGVRFTVSADLDPVQYTGDNRALWEGIAALLAVSEFEGTLSTNGTSFELQLTMLTETAHEPLRTPLRIYGLDSHWGVQSPLLGDTTLMLNNLALLEFGIKANNHLGVPLQQLCLMVPYAHTSALAVLAETLAPLIPSQESVTFLSPEELVVLSQSLAETAEYDRTVRCWIEAVGMSSGTDVLLYSLLPELPDYFARIAPEGLTVTRTADSLTWTGGDATLLSLERIDQTIVLSLALPDVCRIDANLRSDGSVLTGAVHVESPVLNAECSLSMPTSLPMVIPFFMTLQAEGQLAGDPVHIVIDSEVHGDTLILRQLLPDHSRTMCTVTLALAEFQPDPLPAYTPDDVVGVNILSATADSLRGLMGDIGKPLISGLYELIVALPARTVQTFMDMLDDSSILDLLTDAMSGSGMMDD